MLWIILKKEELVCVFRSSQRHYGIHTKRHKQLPLIGTTLHTVHIKYDYKNTNQGEITQHNDTDRGRERKRQNEWTHR